MIPRGTAGGWRWAVSSTLLAASLSLLSSGAQDQAAEREPSRAAPFVSPGKNPAGLIETELTVLGASELGMDELRVADFGLLELPVPELAISDGRMGTTDEARRDRLSSSGKAASPSQRAPTESSSSGLAAARQALRRGDWRQALQESEAALRGNPDDPSPWWDLKAASHLRGGQISLALGAVNDAEQRGQAGALGWTVYARVAAARGAGSLAGAQIERALNAAPTDPEVLYWAAELVADRDRVLELMQRFLAHSAGEPESRIQAVRSAREGLQSRKAAGRGSWRPQNQPQRIEGRLRRLKNRAGLAGWIVELRLGAKQRAVRVLFDTGSSGLFLSRRVAKRTGTQFEVDRRLSGETPRRVTQGVLDRLALGELIYEDATVKAVDVELDPKGRFSGVIGLLPLRGYRITLDPKAGRWSAERSTSAQPAADDSAVTQFDPEAYWWFSGMLVVEVEWRPGQRGLFLLDTGAQRSVVSESAISHGSPGSDESPDRRGSEELWLRGLGGFRRASRTPTLTSLGWGGARVTYAEGFPLLDLSAESEASGVELTGIIGVDLLSQGILSLEPAGQRVRFEPFP